MDKTPDKRDPYNNKQRWDTWKENHLNKAPEGISKANWKIFTEFLTDMESGINTPVGMKGKRDVGTLLNLSAHNLLFLRHLSKPLDKLSKKDLHNFEKEIADGKDSKPPSSSK